MPCNQDICGCLSLIFYSSEGISLFCDRKRQPFFCFIINAKQRVMKEISIEGKSSRTQEHKALSSVKSYAKSHAEKIGSFTTLLGLSYAMLAIEADNFILALIAIAISAVSMLLVRKGGNHDR